MPQRLMSAISAAVIAVVVLALALTTVAGSAAAGRPVRVGLALQPNTLDPLVSSSYTENYIEEAIFSGLTILDDHGDLQPDLATTVPTRANGGISSDLRTLTYHLRHNVRWQDGAPFTAADVAFTFAEMRDPRVPFTFFNIYSIIDRVETPDAYTVVVRLKRPSADAVWQLFVNGQFGMIVPAHVLRGVDDLRKAPFNSVPIGTGPYAVVRWDRGSTIELRANPAYFRGAPHIAELRINFVVDGNTLAIGRRTGELDFAPDLPLTQRTTFIESPAQTVRLVPTYLLDYLIANVTAPPFDDVRVRRAFAGAVDRDVIAARTYRGAAVAADAFVPPWSPFYARVGTGVTGLAAARKALDAAGWRLSNDGLRHKNGTPLAFTLTTAAADPVLLDAAVVLQATWHELGATVDVRPLQTTLLYAPDGILARGNFTLAFVQYGELNRPDIGDNIASFAHPPHGSNYSRYGDVIVDRLLARSRATDDIARRRAIVKEIDERVRDAAPVAPIVWTDFLDAWNADLIGVRPETINSDFWNVADWRWK